MKVSWKPGNKSFFHPVFVYNKLRTIVLLQTLFIIYISTIYNFKDILEETYVLLYSTKWSTSPNDYM